MFQTKEFQIIIQYIFLIYKDLKKGIFLQKASVSQQRSYRRLFGTEVYI